MRVLRATDLQTTNILVGAKDVYVLGVVNGQEAQSDVAVGGGSDPVWGEGAGAGPHNLGDPIAWTILPKDGPSHLGLRYGVLPAHQMALIASGCVPSRLSDGV